MAVSQRDVYLCPHPIDPKSQEPHPFIVLSNGESNAFENTFVAVMITGSPYYDDDLSFGLSDDMFVTPLKKKSKARMHLFMLCLNKEIIGNKINEMKELHFKNMMKEIGSMVFNYSFTPL